LVAIVAYILLADVPGRGLSAPEDYYKRAGNPAVPKIIAGLIALLVLLIDRARDQRDLDMKCSN